MTDTQDTQTSNQSPTASDVDDAPTTRAEPASSEPDDIAPPLVAMIASIRSAVAPSASPEARIAGASACRSILTVLEAKPGQPLTAAPPAPTQPQSPLASLLSQPGLLTQLAAMSREQLLDLLRQVTGAASPRTQSPATGAPRFHLIQIPRLTRPGGG
jgi:hypothetical protein